LITAIKKEGAAAASWLFYRNSLSLGAGGGGGGELFLSGCSSSRAHFIFWLILLQLFSATLLTEGEREL